LNLSVDVSSVALIQFAREHGALYLDTCIEPWAGGYTDPSMPVESRSNYHMRWQALKLRKGHEKSPTAVLTHGANPGLVSHLVKQALLNIAKDTGLETNVPSARADWAKLAQALGIRSCTLPSATRRFQCAKGARQIRQYMVRGWLRERRRAACGTGLGHP
jgi:homospermidine synthase